MLQILLGMSNASTPNKSWITCTIPRESRIPQIGSPRCEDEATALAHAANILRGNADVDEVIIYMAVKIVRRPASFIPIVIDIL